MTDAAFKSNWILAAPRSRKYLIMLMMRAQTPQTITAFKFSIVSLKSFNNVSHTYQL